MKGKSRRERIASMSSAEREELTPFAREVRAKAKREALQVVIEAALSLHTEQERHYAHAGRRHAREQELFAAIEQAHEAARTGPYTDDELLIALTLWDAQKGCPGARAWRPLDTRPR